MRNTRSPSRKRSPAAMSARMPDHDPVQRQVAEPLAALALLRLAPASRPPRPSRPRPTRASSRPRRPASASRFSSISRSRSRPGSLAPRRLSTAPSAGRARPARDSRAASPPASSPSTTAERFSYQCVTSSRIACRSGCGTSTPGRAVAGGEVDLVARRAGDRIDASPNRPPGRTRSRPRRARSPRPSASIARTASTDSAGTTGSVTPSRRPGLDDGAPALRDQHAADLRLHRHPRRGDQRADEIVLGVAVEPQMRLRLGERAPAPPPALRAGCVS